MSAHENFRVGDAVRTPYGDGVIYLINRKEGVVSGLVPDALEIMILVKLPRHGQLRRVDPVDMEKIA